MDRTSWGVFEEGDEEEEKLNHPDFFPLLATKDELLGDLVWDLCVDPIPLKGGGGELVEFEIAELCVVIGG